MAFDFITASIELVNKGLEKFIPDANLRQQATMEISQQANMMVMGQIALNQEEAKNPAFFQSGWRPATGWVCVGGLAYQVIARPVIQSIVTIWHPEFEAVPLELDTLLTLLFGMLGLGAYRTYEKVNKAA